MILGVLYIFTGIVLILVCIPLLHDRVKPNAFYGMRLKKAFESEENWYKINRRGAQLFIGWGGILMGLGVPLFFVPIARDGLLSTILIFVPLIVALLATWQLLRYAKTL